MKQLKLTCFFLAITISLLAQSSQQHQKLTLLASDFIRLYNTGDTAAYKQFLNVITPDNNKLNDLLKRYQNTYRTIGKVEVRKIKHVSPTIVEAWVQENNFQSWWKFTIHTDSVQRFQRRTVEPVGFTTYFIQTGVLTTKQLSEQTDQYITQKLGSNFSGNVLILQNNKEVYSRSFGNNTAGKPNTRSQLFSLASLGKMFTAISVLQLMEANKLTLDDSVAKLLPNLKNKAIAPVTVRQLLTHTSGMGDYFESPFFHHIMDSLKLSHTQMIQQIFPTNAAYEPLVEADQLLFEPSKGWAYSNTGFALLGLIIEKMSGTPFETYIQQNIFDKAGMKTAIPGQGSGGGMATVDDLYSFARALTNNQLLSVATTNELLTYTINDKYGYGTEHQTLGTEHIVGHSGGFENVCTELNIYRHNKNVVIILSNSNPPFGHFLSNKLKELLVRNKAQNIH